MNHARNSLRTGKIYSYAHPQATSTQALPEYFKASASQPWAMDLDQPQVHYDTAGSTNGSDGAHRRDLMHKIKGLYRLLDIYSKEGIGGLGTIAPLIFFLLLPQSWLWYHSG